MRQAKLAIILAASLLVSPASAQSDGLTLDSYNRNTCSALSAGLRTADGARRERVIVAQNACIVPSSLGEAKTRAALDGKTIAFVRQGAVLTVLARAPGKAVSLSGDLNTPMTQIGASEYWQASYRLAEIDRAIVSVHVLDENNRLVPNSQASWSGPHNHRVTAVTTLLRGTVLERTLWSDALGETRGLTIYLPPNHRQDGHYPALFMGDGEYVRRFAPQIERLVDEGLIRPIVLVGANSGQNNVSPIVEKPDALNEGDIRGGDYIPDFEGAGDRSAVRFMAFFANELVRYAEREFSVSSRREDRAVQGQSNAAVLALQAGAQHPEIFSNAIVLSAGFPLKAVPPAKELAAFCMNAGLYEPGFYMRTRESAELLQKAGAQVTASFTPNSHNHWTEPFVACVTQIFGKR